MGRSFDLPIFFRPGSGRKKMDKSPSVYGAQVPDMETVDGQIYVESFLDGDLVMEESNLVVCHGGNGTIYQALNHGKPIIGIPTIPDQRFNMRRVEALGVGQSLSCGKFHNNPRVLFDAINAILLSPSFAKNARRMQKRLKNYEGEKIGADIIERRFSNS